MADSKLPYLCNVLHVDLSTGATRRETLAPELLSTMVGGYGINNLLAYKMMSPDVEPLSPQNLIIVGAGPLTGTLVPGAAKTMITTKFPINNAFGTAVGGGRFALMLRSAGYEHLVISGCAKQPVCLVVSEKGVELSDASFLRGKDTFETVDALRSEYEPCSVIPTGPAGEHLVPLSVTSIDKLGTIGSGGLPAVMGSKNLEAIVIRQGTVGVKISHPRTFFNIVNRLHSNMLDWHGRRRIVERGMRPGPDERRDEGGVFKNWTEFRPDLLDAEARATLVELHTSCRKVMACPGCPLAEKEMIVLSNGEVNLRTYVTHFLYRRFGATNPEEEYLQTVKHTDVANRLGVCLTNFYSVFLLAAELYRQGIITMEDTGGRELREDFDTAIWLMHRIAYREGIGAPFADGLRGIAQRYGEQAAMQFNHIKGRAIVYDPRLRGLGSEIFTQITRPRGSHVASGMSPTYIPGRSERDFERYFARTGVTQESASRIIDSGSLNPGRLTRYSEDWWSIFNCLGLCAYPFMERFYDIDTLVALYTAVTGMRMTPHAFRAAGERAWLLERILNINAGFTPEDDRPPQSWFSPLKTEDGELPLVDYYGTTRLTENDVKKFLGDYYEERGYDKKSGMPTRRKLKQLGLDKLL